MYFSSCLPLLFVSSTVLFWPHCPVSSCPILTLYPLVSDFWLLIPWRISDLYFLLSGLYIALLLFHQILPFCYLPSVATFWILDLDFQLLPACVSAFGSLLFNRNRGQSCFNNQNLKKCDKIANQKQIISPLIRSVSIWIVLVRVAEFWRNAVDNCLLWMKWKSVACGAQNT